MSTPNLERLLGFYRDLLGFEVAMKGRWAPGKTELDRVVGLEQTSGKICFLKLGNAYLELFEYHTPEGRPPELNRPVSACGLTHICIDVDDVDAEYQRLAAAGVRFHCLPQVIDGMAKTTYARDPDDNVVELQQILEKGRIIELGAGVVR
jgi:catechol 2,3-dioxygenase-like lactoylglutathione lyase family enzyme